MAGGQSLSNQTHILKQPFTSSSVCGLYDLYFSFTTHPPPPTHVGLAQPTETGCGFETRIQEMLSD